MASVDEQDVLPELVEHPGDPRVGHDLEGAGAPSPVEAPQALLSDHLLQSRYHVGRALPLQGPDHQPLPGDLQREADGARRQSCAEGQVNSFQREEPSWE